MIGLALAGLSPGARRTGGALALAAALLAAAFWAGWQQGSASERRTWQARVTQLQSERARAAAQVAGLTEALQAAGAERAALARKLEDLADADDDADTVALPARSLRRLDSR